MLDVMDISETSSAGAPQPGPVSHGAVTFPNRLTFVYDADGTLRGEVTYIVGHLLGRLSCSMCDISHGPLGRRKSWTAWVQALAVHQVEVVTAHRDELDPDVEACLRGKFPAVVATTISDTHRFVQKVMDKAQLEACQGRVDLLAAHLVAAKIIPPT
jgi:hypothetical protein